MRLELDERVLKRVLAWAEDLEGFTDQHARHGLTFAQLVIDGMRRGADGATDFCNDRALFLLAIDSACCALWLDDRFDRGSQRVNVEALLRAAQGEAATPEARGFARLCARFREEARNETEYDLWLETALQTFHAYEAGALVSRGERTWSYAEYMDSGEHGVVIAHLMTGVSLAHGLGMPQRMRDPRFRRFVSHLCRAMRLQNDLASVERERADGVHANAVLVLEDAMGPTQARAFVSTEKDGYRRLLSKDLDELGTRDIFSVLARALWSAAEYFYVVDPARYQGS